MEKQGEWVSIPQAAELLGIGERAVRNLIADGRLTCRSVPGSFPRVLKAEVIDLAEKCTAPARAS